jgi:hypothetical protein
VLEAPLGFSVPRLLGLGETRPLLLLGAERKYVYDDGGKLIRVSGSNGDHTDEFRYDEHGRKTRIQVVPARPEQRHRAFGIAAEFDAVLEGDTLDEKGTVETRLLFVVRGTRSWPGRCDFVCATIIENA